MKRRIIVDSMIVNAGLQYGFDGKPCKNSVCLLPYKDRTIIGRVLREIWFRLRLPEKFWYNKRILRYLPNHIIIKDSLITSSFLEWIKEHFYDSTTISFQYDNLVGKAKNISPQQIPGGIRITTYDAGDSSKYNIILTEGHEFPRSFIKSKLEIKYDVFYIGADKGRGDYVMGLKHSLDALGLKSKIIITRDGRLSPFKRYYSKRIPYRKVLEYNRKSKAILNVILPGQIGPTRRDFESVFFNCKLITNNKNIVNFDFYKKENVFILGERDVSELPVFLNTKFVELDEEILERHLRD